MTEVSAGTLTDFLLARIAEDETDTLSMDCRCEDDWDHIRPDCPSRILVECEAKRRIVREWIKHDGPTRNDLVAGARWALDMAVTWLAQPYADHRDFRPEWRQ